MNKIVVASILCFLMMASACNDDDQIPSGPTNINPAEGFFVINEGAFNFGNASVSYYNFESEEISHDLFKNANGHVAGDVLQDMVIHEDKGYLVLNNSGYVEVVDMETFESQSNIQPFESPRYLLPLSESKAYVSDLYSNSIQVVDLEANMVTGNIEMPFWTEGMVAIEEKVFVASPWDVRVDAHDHIYVVDSNTDSLLDSIQTGYDPAAIALDKNNKLWVYCRGAEELNELPGLYCINTTSLEVERQLDFENHDLGFGARLAFNGTRDTLYYLKKNVYQFPLDNAELPQAAFINAGGKTFYALGVNPNNGNVIVGDAIDYAQKGDVFIYSAQGGLIKSFEAGVIPSKFVFY